MRKLKEEELREILGDCFVPQNTKDKGVYLSAINRFINKVPSFKPGIKELNTPQMRRGRPWYLSFQDRKGWKVLQLNYFYLDYRYYQIVTRNGCSLCIMVDDNNVKHIVRKSAPYAQPKEINTSLGLTTLKSLYRLFVEDMLYPTVVLRSLKLIDTMCNEWNEKLKDCMWYSLTNQKCKNFRKIYKFELSKKEIGMNVHLSDFYLRKLCPEMSTGGRCITYLSGIPRILKYFDDLTNGDLSKGSILINKDGFANIIAEHMNEIKESLISAENTIIRTCCEI